ncbi:MAG: sugar-binding protein [Armatimonadota bacterium]|nr:sugar-binding protein [Armatimonadota bacterium]
MRALLLVICSLCLMPLLAGQEVRGPITIYDTVYEQVDPGAPFNEAPREAENWQPPAPTFQERAAGFIPYTRPEPFDLKPWSKPKEEQRVKELRVFAAQGEITCAWFAVYALEPLERFQVTVQPVPGIRITPLYAHYWAQRTDWRGRTYYITPELLLEMREGRAQFPARGGVLEWRDLNVPQGETRLFWLQVRVSPQVKAGDYVVNMRVQAQGKAVLALPLRVHVYPFRLQKPQNKRWLLYSDSWRLSYLPDDRLLALMREIAAYGIDGFTELPFGELDLSELKEGRVRYNPAPLLRWHRLMQQAGLRGPHTIGTFIEDQVPGRLGIEADVNREWTPPVRDAVRLVARTVIETLRPHGIDWMFYGWDEPGPDTIRALEQYRTWREAGANTYVTFYQRETYNAAAQWMTHPCFAAGLVASAQLASWAREQCLQRGQRFYWYGSGCYLGQEGRMFPNRFLAGWLFWKTRADGQVSWTFVRPFEDPFNDFDGANHNPVEPKDQCTVYPHYTQPGDLNSLVGIIPTIQWEALREGITDYRYLHTLRNTVAYAKRMVSGRTDRWARQLNRLAQECEQTLRALEESVPWLGEVGRTGYNNGDLQETRLVIGQCLERLVRHLRGESSRVSARAQPVRIEVQLVAPVSYPISARFLPVLTLPRWERPPAIDGHLDEPQWQTAAVASPFYETESSVPAPDALRTEALLAADDEALYIGFRCRAPRPQLLVAEQTRRDAFAIWLDEGVEIFLASPAQPTKYAHFILNLNGALYDELGFDASWNTEIQYATHTSSEGWTLEVAIPWRSLPFAVDLRQRGQPLLRLNLGRNHKERGKARTSHWAWSPTFGWFHNTERFGVALLQQGEIVVRRVTPPSYVDDPPLRISLRNTGTQAQTVQVGTQSVVLQAGEEKEVTVPSRREPGQHLARVPLRWRGGRIDLQVAYAIFAPLQLVKRVVVATGERAVRIPVACAFRHREGKKLQVTLPSGVVRVPITVERFSIRLDSVSRSPLPLSFSVEGYPQWKDSLKVHFALAP